MEKSYKQLVNLRNARIVFIYIFILSLCIAVSYFVYQTGGKISQVNHQLTAEQLPLLSYSSQLEHWSHEHERILYEQYATEDEQSNLPKLLQAQDNIRKNLLWLNGAFPKNENIKLLASINEKTVETGAQIFKVLISNKDERWTEVRDLLASVSSMGRKSQPLINALNNTIKEEIAISNQHSIKQLNEMSSWVSVFSLVVLLLAFSVGYYILYTMKENAEKRRLALFMAKSPNAIASLNWQGELIFENTAWKKRFASASNSDFVAQLRKKIAVLKRDDESLMYWNIHSNSQDLEVNIHKITKLNQVMVFVENITDRVKAQRSLEFLAYNDPITGLPNFKKLEVDLDEHVIDNENEPLYLVTIGVKRIKIVSTTHGNSVSDALMKALSVRIRNAMLPIDYLFQKSTLYRYAGTKFVVVLKRLKESHTHESLFAQIDDCIQAATDTLLKTAFGNFHLDLQMGGVVYPEHGANSHQLIKNVNAVINEAQIKNKKELAIFNSELSAKEQHRYEMEDDLRSVDFEREFYLVYQPKVNLKDGTMLSMEALIRWQHPELGLISPVDFIPIAEECGLINSIGLWVLSTACKQTKQWCTEYKVNNLQVAVNVSPSQLLGASFVEDVLSCLKRADLSPQRLEIEITEEVLMEDQEACVEVLNELKEAGITIAVDDFGTGYSSLGYLNKFPLGKLKIDRSFITNIHQNASNKAIVNAIITLAHNLGVLVVAEGIETKEELDVLIALNCDQGQGYLFDKPLNVDDFARYFRDKKQAVNSHITLL